MIMNKVYLDQTGLAVFLGGKTQELVYRAVQAKSGSVTSIRSYVNAKLDKPLAYTTVATIANKLCDKGILKRVNAYKTIHNKPEYCYSILLDENRLVRCAMHRILTKLLEEQPAILNELLREIGK